MFKSAYRKVAGAGVVVSALAAPVVAGATGTPYDSIVAAADVSTLSTTVVTILVSMVGIALIFTAYRFIRKSIRG